MGNGTRSGLRNKDAGSHSSRKSVDNREGTSNSSCRTANTSGSKKLANGASSGQRTSSPPSIRKSERLEKRTPPATPITRKSKRLVNHNTPSPLRRSDRGKKHYSSSPLVSNHSGKIFSSADAKKKKEKKEKSIKQLTMKSQKLVSDEEYEQGSIGSKRKKMDARSYKSFFKSQKRRYLISDSDAHTDSIESGGSDTKLIGDMENGVKKYDHALSPPVGLSVVIEQPREPLRAASEAAPPRPAPNFEDIDADMSVNDVEKNFSLPIRANNLSEKFTGHLNGVDGNISLMGCITKAAHDDATEGLKNYSTAETSKNLELVAPINVQRSIGHNTCSESSAQRGKSNSPCCKRNIQSKVTEKEFGKDICASIVDCACLTPANLKKHDIVRSCAVCYKKRRLAYNSPVEELCSCTAVEKDTGDVELAFNSESIERCDHVTGLNDTLSDVWTDNDGNVCVKCKQPRELLYCCGKACRRCYHLSRLDPILHDASPGVWHCSCCTKKKMKFGIYSVTKGVESIWDAREVVVSDTQETRRQKQYLVKYQGLAHVYNHWIPESRLLLETPSIIAKYNAKNQVRVWNSEWTVPSRLLRRRPLISTELEDECSSLGTDNISDCQYEWLVKWCGLDYVDATWELENSNFLQSPQGQKLIQKYEIRYEKAKRMLDKTTKGPFVKLKDRLSTSGSTLIDDYYLQNVNKLRELWYKSQNAVVFDDQERFANVIFFISSLSNDHQPFLIISSSEALSQWEAEFLRLAPSVDVVLYKGNADTRSSIRTLEFHEDDKGGVMFQVLLSPIEFVIEDLQFLKWLKWKVIVIDDCQSASPDLKQMKMLDTDMRLLLFSGPIKDTVAEYSSLLSLLDSPDDLDRVCGLESDTNDNLVKLKELLSRITAYNKFVEYLVPIEISNLQLEQYCGTLLANAPALRSNCKTDQVGAFKEILLTLRKCCDHPYMVASSLQSSITKGLNHDKMMEIGIEASGKLQLLQEMLSKIRNQKLRALVLFQSLHGFGQMTIGDILDDVVRGKFGPNSYERIDAGLALSKKQAALSRFNNIGGEHFVFLLENRACHPSIKLSVDVVIIFDSDWNPANDLKALQRLTIHSRSEQVNVFRLYSCCTIEEKVLILWKQNLNLESSLQTVRNNSSLLMWGATYLFNRLNQYHTGNGSDNDAGISYGKKLLCDVVSELSAIQSGCFNENDEQEPVISKVFRDAGTCSTSCPLLGESKTQLADLEEPHIFWKMLLEGKNPKWKFSFGQTPRSRKRVHYAEEALGKSDRENDETGRKRKKVISTILSASSVQTDQEASQVAASNKGASVEQKSLHAFVKEEMVKLCEILKLSKEVKQIIDKFLEYVMENHHVNKEPESILQAFQMSLCWTAASILKQKMDKKDSLELAKRVLDFKCTEEEASSVYLKLRSLKKTFLQLPGIISGSIPQYLKSASGSISPLANAGEPPLGSFSLQNVEENQEYAQPQELNNKLTGNCWEKKIKKIQKTCAKHISKLHQEHEQEIQEFHKMWAEKEEKLKADHRHEVIFVRAIHGSGPMGMDKLKMSDTEFAKKMAEFEHLKELQLKELEAKHSAAIEEERKKIANRLAEAESWSTLSGTVNEVCSRGYELDEIGFSNTDIDAKGTGNNVSPSGLNIEEQVLGRSDAIPSNLPVPSVVEAFDCEISTGTALILLNSNSEKESEIGLVEASCIPGVEQRKESCHPCQAVEDIPVVDRSIENYVTDEITPTNQPSGESFNTGCETEHAQVIRMSTSVNISTSKEQTADDEISLTNQRHVVATGVSGDAELGMGPYHALDTPVELVVAGDKGSVTSDITRNQKDQPDVDLTDSSPVSTDMQNEDTSCTGNHTTIVGTICSTPSGAGTKSLSNWEEIENSEQLEQASEDIAPGISQCPAVEHVHQGHPEGGNSLQNSVASPQLQEEPVEVQNQTVSQDAENLVLHPPVELLNSVQGQNHPDLLTANRADSEPNSELSLRSCGGEPQVSQNVPGLANQAVLESGPTSAVDEASHQLYGAHRVASWNATSPSHAEPLQNELERIRKEMDQVIKLHDSMKLQLKSDCEKEIAEMTAQICSKYEEKIKDAETVFELKKAELESNRNKVLMNKILAEAFRSKCMDLRPSGVLGVPQVVPSSFMQHLHQLTTFRPSMRHSPVISQHTVNLPVQSTHRSPGNFSGLPARPPLINAITPTKLNARVGGEIRAPAPHLQPFRPPACTCSSNMPTVPCNPNQHLPVNVPVTSPSLSPFPPPKALFTASQFSQPNLPPAPLPPVKNNLSGPGNQFSESEGGVKPCSHNISLSALELLRNVHNHPSGQAPNIPCSGSSASAVDVTSDVVCLSDDDDL